MCVRACVPPQDTREPNSSSPAVGFGRLVLFLIVGEVFERDGSMFNLINLGYHLSRASAPNDVMTTFKTKTHVCIDKTCLS